MTKKELSQLYYLNREIAQEKLRLQELREAATNTAAKISGLPHIGSISDKTALAAAIADAEAIIEAKTKLAVVEYNRLNRYIAEIPDSMIRQIVCLRYVKGMTWGQIAWKIGGGNTPDSTRKTIERFLSREK